MKNKKLHNNNSNIQIDLHKLFHIFVIIGLLIMIIPYVMLLLKFICNCTCTRTITGQQQHEIVTAAATTKQNTLHKLLSVQELIFPIQQLNMNTSSEKLINTSSEKLILICTCHLMLWGVYLSTSSDKLT